MLPNQYLNRSKPVKCVIIGDQNVGKTCFLSAYLNPSLSCQQEYIPTVFDTSWTVQETHATAINLGLFDTSGSSEYGKIRLETYNRADVFIIAFAIDDRKSFANVKKKWIKEIQRHVDNGVPILLVGMKADVNKERKLLKKEKSSESIKMLEDYHKDFLDRMASSPEGRAAVKKVVKYAQAEAVAKEIGAIGYLECSALQKEGIEEIFEQILRIGYKKR